ncbi:MAG: sigma-54-dependent Fis family transcriptional regulator, partial [Gammaproteobacteria bacterium]|nr:sigma-54-dependent Fis family transcriptional regulator [Gammaproteobacteria bacterium]
MIEVLVVEDDRSLREAICDMLDINDIEHLGVENGQKAIETLQKETVQVVISDVQMSPVNGYELLNYINEHHFGLPVILMTAYGSIPQAVDAIQAGAVDYLVKPFDVKDLIQSLRSQLSPQASNESGLIAKDSVSLELVKLVKKVAATDATVLLNGESGVGKEVYSQYIHQQSDRAEQPFVAINCAAIPENMLEAVLFGYEKGAFTGAYKSTAGKFELAQNGTLLLDEISEMDLSLQAKLLRVIQEREVERLGGQKSIQLDVRIIATTNRDLKKEVAEKRFREDLYYRLNVFPLSIPALKQRPDDILPIAELFIHKYSKASGQKVMLSPSATVDLKSYSWPGNIRELENVIQRALILKEGDKIESDDIMLEAVEATAINATTENDTAGQLQNDLKDREAEVIIETLKAFSGSRKKTAENLGISPRTL